MNLGGLKIDVLSDGSFKLDGGAMFGIVPKPLWEKQILPDDRNRIRLGLSILLIDDGKERMIVETGIGSKFDARLMDRYGIERRMDAVGDLASKGLKPEDIDKVILTHLHFDHAGGGTRIDASGKPVPTYPRATYFIQRAEWEDCLDPNERTVGSYLSENTIPLEKAAQVELLDGDARISERVRVQLTGGHTRGHQIVFVESQGETLVHLGDLVPTSHHLPLPYIMGYDTFPLVTLEMRKSLYRSAVNAGWKLFFGHDFSPKIAQLKEMDGRYVLNDTTLTYLKRG